MPLIISGFCISRDIALFALTSVVVKSVQSIREVNAAKAANKVNPADAQVAE